MSISQLIAIVKIRARRTQRQLTDSTQFLSVVLIFTGLISLGIVAPGQQGTYQLGQMVASGQVATVSKTLTAGFTIGSLGIFVLGTFRAAITVGQFDEKDALQAVTIPVRTQSAGQILSEWLVYPAMLVVPLLIGGATFAIGAGPVAGIMLFLVALITTITIVSLSYLFGICIVYAIERLGLSGRQRILVGLIGLGIGESVIVYRETVLQYAEVPPMVWFPDVALAATPATTPGLIKIVTILSAPFVSVLFAVLVTERLIPYVWFQSQIGERRTSPNDETTTEKHKSLLPLNRIQRFPTRVSVLADLTVRRTIREPSSLVRGAIGVVVVALVGVQILQTPTSNAVFPATAVILSSSVSGIGPLLNPLGNDDDALPALLGTGIRPREYVEAKVITGYIFAVPTVMTIVTVALVLAGVTAIPYIIVTAILAVTSALTLPALAVGIGCSLPKIENSAVISGRQLIRSNNTAVATFTVLSTLTLLPGAGAAIALGTPETQFELGALLGSVVISVVGLLLAGTTGYRLAVVNVGRFSIDGHNLSLSSFTKNNTVTNNESVQDKLVSVGVTTVVGLTVFVVTSLVTIPISLLVGVDTLQTRAVATGITSLVVICVAMVFVFLFRGGTRHFDIRKPSKKHVGLAFVTVITLVGVQLGVDRAALIFEIDAGGLNLSGTTTSSALVTFAVATLFAAPTEELLYRNIIQKRLRKTFSSTSAVLLASTIFTVTHFPNFLQASAVTVLLSLFKILLSSIVLGILYEKTENILINMVCHSVFNGAAVVAAVVFA